MGGQRKVFRRTTGYRSIGGWCLGVGLVLLLVSLGNGASAQPARTTATSQVAKAASASKTAFQCEKAFQKGSQGRIRCFDQLPGANCAHPLEAQKAGPTTRGEHRYFTLSFNEEAEEIGTPRYGAEQHYSWAPKQNVAICPYPNGAVYKVSLLSDTNRCHRTPSGGEDCSVEYDTRNHPEPTTSRGGHFHFYMTAVPIKSWYLVVKGYFIHPPWEHHG